MTLSASVEKTIRNSEGEVEHQELRISATANSYEEAKHLAYEDFKIEVIINGNIIYDFSMLFSKAGLFADLVDSNDWEKQYFLAVREATEANNIEQLENK